jgi:hypothetical protein
LGLVIDIQGFKLRLCSIYGPNENDISFFNDLTRFLTIHNDLPIIIGGDWNATYSTAAANSNIDVINMVNSPSQIRSSWLQSLCEDFSLLDPYRSFYPTMRDFTFFPSTKRKHRSRLDFFLIGQELLNSVRSASIAPWLSTALFDHKSITLSFCREKKKNKINIRRTILHHPRIDDIVLATYADTYLAHPVPGQAVARPEDALVHHAAPPNRLDEQKVTVGHFLSLIREYNTMAEKIEVEGNSPLLELQLAEKN